MCRRAANQQPSLIRGAVVSSRSLPLPFRDPLPINSGRYFAGSNRGLGRGMTAPVSARNSSINRVQLPDAVRMLGRKVQLFAEVLLQIEQLVTVLTIIATMEDADQLPIA